MTPNQNGATTETERRHVDGPPPLCARARYDAYAQGHKDACQDEKCVLRPEEGTYTDRLKAAILDIDAHAAPLAQDDGFAAGGYIISVGSLHRALGVVGHAAAKCPHCTAESHSCVSEGLS